MVSVVGSAVFASFDNEKMETMEKRDGLVSASLIYAMVLLFSAANRCKKTLSLFESPKELGSRFPACASVTTAK